MTFDLSKKRMFRKYRKDFRYFYPEEKVKEFIKLLKEDIHKNFYLYYHSKMVLSSLKSKINKKIDKLAGKELSK